MAFNDKEQGGYAFPAALPATHSAPEYMQEGMTLRDYFAAKALQGICASDPGVDWSNGMLAKEAYALADAMISERNR